MRLRGELNAELTPREREVARMVGQAWSNRTIARRLGCSIKTVEAHTMNIAAKRGYEPQTGREPRIIVAQWAWVLAPQNGMTKG